MNREGRSITSRKHVSDIRTAPAYPMAEAARYVRVPGSTLRAWVREDTGRTGSARHLIALPNPRGTQLSFLNLVEAQVLRALRTDHKVSIKAVRRAIDYAERELGIEHLLVHPQLTSSGGQLLLDEYGKLTNLSQSGQLAMRAVLEQSLRRIVWDDANIPTRLHPMVHETLAESRSIVIDPRIGFGRPLIASKCISTEAIRRRLDAGETVEEVAADYRISKDEVTEAVLYELAA